MDSSWPATIGCNYINKGEFVHLDIFSAGAPSIQSLTSSRMK